jgi:transcriptional regulator NrdR family protein
VLKNSSLAPFASEKLYMSIYSTLEPSEQSLEHARALLYTITAKLLKKRGGATVKAEVIAETTARTLKRFNKLAYIKYVANHPSLHDQLRFK